MPWPQNDKAVKKKLRWEHPLLCCSCPQLTKNHQISFNVATVPATMWQVPRWLRSLNEGAPVMVPHMIADIHVTASEIEDSGAIKWNVFSMVSRLIVTLNMRFHSIACVRNLRVWTVSLQSSCQSTQKLYGQDSSAGCGREILQKQWAMLSVYQQSLMIRPHTDHQGRHQ